jgi:hypothetical protein
VGFPIAVYPVGCCKGRRGDIKQPVDSITGVTSLNLALLSTTIRQTAQHDKRH